MGRHLRGERAVSLPGGAGCDALLDEDGAFVFIGSAAGLKAGTRFPAYDSSKAALFGLTRHVALEGAPRRIRANYVIPGPVDTPLGRVGDATVTGRTKIRWPLGRQASAWDIAYATYSCSAPNRHTSPRSRWSWTAASPSSVSAEHFPVEFLRRPARVLHSSSGRPVSASSRVLPGRQPPVWL